MIWNLLPENPAYSFIGFVWSNRPSSFSGTSQKVNEKSLVRARTSPYNTETAPGSTTSEPLLVNEFSSYPKPNDDRQSKPTTSSVRVNSPPRLQRPPPSPARVAESRPPVPETRLGGDSLNYLNKSYRIERDSRGHERLVRSKAPRSRAQSTRELLDEAEEREQILNGEIASLQTRFSCAQRDSLQHQKMANEHQQCGNIR